MHSPLMTYPAHPPLPSGPHIARGERETRRRVKAGLGGGVQSTSYPTGHRDTRGGFVIETGTYRGFPDSGSCVGGIVAGSSGSQPLDDEFSEERGSEGRRGESDAVGLALGPRKS